MHVQRGLCHTLCQIVSKFFWSEYGQLRWGKGWNTTKIFGKVVFVSLCTEKIICHPLYCIDLKSEKTKSTTNWYFCHFEFTGLQMFIDQYFPSLYMWAVPRMSPLFEKKSNVSFTFFYTLLYNLTSTYKNSYNVPFLFKVLAVLYICEINDYILT